MPRSAAIKTASQRSVAVAILSVDRALRERLAMVEQGEVPVAIVGIEDNTAAFLRLMDRTQPNVVVLDMPGPGQVADCLSNHTGLALVVLCDPDDIETGIDAVDAGARAVLPREASGSDIAAAIKAAASGYVMLKSDLLSQLLTPNSITYESFVDTNGEAVPLTPRELDVLRAMANGASNKAIARELAISVHTVKFHVAAILAKLDADTRTEAVAKAAQRGLIML
jgi:DNA-binding NarL/FixJ family response regulator